MYNYYVTAKNNLSQIVYMFLDVLNEKIIITLSKNNISRNLNFLYKLYDKQEIHDRLEYLSCNIPNNFEHYYELAN
jgi:hypothetical protein